MFGAILVLLILIILLIQCMDKAREIEIDPECQSTNCLQFCCKSEKCNLKYIEDNFNINEMKEKDKFYDYERKKVKAVIHQPNCSLRHLVDEGDWLILDVIKILFFNDKIKFLLNHFRMAQLDP